METKSKLYTHAAIFVDGSCLIIAEFVRPTSYVYGRTIALAKCMHERPDAKKVSLLYLTNPSLN